jgi:hypothetical protein
MIVLIGALVVVNRAADPTVDQNGALLGVNVLVGALRLRLAVPNPSSLYFWGDPLGRPWSRG